MLCSKMKQCSQNALGLCSPFSHETSCVVRGVYPYLPMATNAPWSILGESIQRLHRIVYIMSKNCLRGGRKGEGRRDNGGVKSAMVVGG